MVKASIQGNLQFYCDLKYWHKAYFKKLEIRDGL